VPSITQSNITNAVSPETECVRGVTCIGRRGARNGERSTDFGMTALHITAAEIEDCILGIARYNLVEAAPVEGSGEGCRKFFGFCCQWTCCHTFLRTLVRSV